jgi:hypothetical protein
VQGCRTMYSLVTKRLLALMCVAAVLGAAVLQQHHTLTPQYLSRTWMYNVLPLPTRNSVLQQEIRAPKGTHALIIATTHWQPLQVPLPPLLICLC